MVVLALDAADRAELQRALVALQWGGAWFTSVLLREALAAIEPHTQHAVLALDLVHVALEQEDLQETALALVNALATRRGLRRASIGVIRQGQVKLLVVSHAAHTPTKANAALILQAAMEEALDQCATVCYPLGERADRPALHITLAHAELLKQGDAVGVISAILMQTGQPFGVLSCEYATGRFEPDAETPVIEAIAGLLGPALAQQLQLDAWVSGKLRRKTRQFWTHLFGPYHAKLKLLALAAVATLGFLLLAAGEFRISARTVLEGQIQRAAVAPFDGYIDTALVRAGDRVRKDQVLATLDEHDLALEQVRWRAERDQADRKLKTARADHDRAAVAVLDAQLAQAAAELALVDKKLARTKILAPFDGIVVAGDLSQQLGSPVDTVKALFEIATIDRYRVVLKVDERDVSHLALGQRGHLVLNGLATRPVAITVERMTAIATAEEGANVFRVEASLEPGAVPGLQPGMEGIAKIEIGERGLWWIWTRRLSDWVRVQFWTWWP